MALTPNSSVPHEQALRAALGSTPGRRSVLRAAAWSVPAVSLAAATPAFAVSNVVTQPVTFTSTLFWRPKGAEIPADQAGYWGFIPEETVIWVTQITNTGTAAVSNVVLDLAVPSGGTKHEFSVLDSSKLTVSPAVFAKTNRPADGHLVVTLPQVPAGAPVALTVALERPSTVARLSSQSWSLTVTPPAGGTTVSVPVVTYAQVLAAGK